MRGTAARGLSRAELPVRFPVAARVRRAQNADMLTGQMTSMEGTGSAPPPADLPPRREMERAYLNSDASYDGVFYLGVRTTGVFCRPSCHARKPRRENVEFFARPREALFAGYRPCKKCRPLEGAADPPWVARLLARVDASADGRIRERDLRGMGVEPARVRRYFTARYGMTFQAYARARRLARAFESIRQGQPLDDAVFDTGYESHSGFRDAFRAAFGRAPGAVQRSATAVRCVHLAWIDTPLGPMVAGATDGGVCLLEFTDRRMLEHQLRTVRRRLGAALLPGDHRFLSQLRQELAEYFDGARRRFSVPIVAPGTVFEERVWAALASIPYGETRAYADIAAAVGSAAAVRAVGRANGMNRIAILIPCHRVVNRNGELGGYGGGLWRKRRLLQLERTSAD